MDTLFELSISILAAYLLTRGLQLIYNLSLDIWERYSDRMVNKANLYKKNREYEKEKLLCKRMLFKLKYRPLIKIHRAQYAYYWARRLRGIKVTLKE